MARKSEAQKLVEQVAGYQINTDTPESAKAYADKIWKLEFKVLSKKFVDYHNFQTAVTAEFVRLANI